MESMSAYIVSIVTALTFVLIAALISVSIKFEGGSNPRDHKKRKMWFWTLCVLAPVVNFLLGFYVFMPDGNRMITDEFTTALAIGTGVALVLYIVLGFVLSKMFRHGKLGNWF
ncbi:MAG: hypothetical protein EOP50_04555 [Sphingobacteriales bacterium]|nr:MAG: hypothetical protein EOP50_04555 [Sphingobacteriales bacterium]